MKRFDRYVLGGFAVALGATLVLVLVLYVVADAFQHLEEFVRHFGREGVVAGVGVVLRYYACRFLTDVSTFGEILALAPAVIVAAAMARANEFVAPLAAGMSIRRLALPIFISCALVGAFAFAFRTLAGPTLVRQTLADKRRIYGYAGTLGTSLSVQGRSGRSRSPGAPEESDDRPAVTLSVESYDASRARARGFDAAVIEPGKPFARIRSPVAVWDKEAGAWRFPRGGRKWSYGLPVSAGEVGGRGEAPSRESKKPAFEEVTEFRTALGADLLEAEELGACVLSLRALYSQRARPEFARALHGRLAQLVAPVALVLAALPFVLTTERSRVFQRVCLAILVAAAYELAARAGAGYVDAFLGGWLAPAAFAAFGGWRLARIET